MITDTIAAIATALSPSGIGIIRISGEEAFEVANRIFKAKSGKSILEMASHTVHYGHIYDGDEIIDEVMVLLMKAPNSFTMEDTVEIDCHGGVYVMNRILQTVLKNGARLSEPGEFTKRAFLNGRIDLTKAEAIMDLIQSKNEAARKNSMTHLKGDLYRKIKALTNYSPVELLRITRLKKASVLLSTTDKTISEVTYEVGFTSPSYFTKCYKEYFGESPSDFLKRKNS
jgi:tRNA modification GTPase